MSTTEYSGYAFVNENGVCKGYNGDKGIPDKHWVFSLYWTEPDHGFVRANQIHLHVDLNSMYSFEFAREVFEKASFSLPEEVTKGLGRMLASSKRSAVFSRREL